MIKDNLIKNLHKNYRQDKWLNELLSSSGLALDDIIAAMKDFEQQYWFDTMTWSIPILEKKLKFKTNSNDSIEDRRSQLEARWKSNGKSDSAMIKAIVNSFTPNLVDVRLTDIIKTTISSQEAFNLKLNSMLNAIDDVKAAHLIYELNLQTPKQVNIKSKYTTNRNLYTLCGTMDTKLPQQNLTENKTLNIIGSYTVVSNPYPVCGAFSL